MKNVMLFALLIPVTSIVYAATNLEVALTNLSGNNSRREYVTKLDNKSQKGSGTYHKKFEARSAEESGSQVTESYDFMSKGDFEISRNSYQFVSVGWQKDRFAGLKSRLGIESGVGKNYANDMRLEAGLRHTSELRKGEKGTRFASLRLGINYEKDIYIAVISWNAEYLDDFKNSDSWRFNGDLGFTKKMSRNLLTRLSHGVKYVHAPPSGFGKVDRVTLVSIILELE